MDAGFGLILASDGATAIAAAFNAAWLVARRVTRARGGRRLAAVALAALNGGIAVEATFAQALFAAHRLGLETAPLFATAPWLAARLPLLVATLLLSLLILRRDR